jgi:hypothetical protein
MRALLLSYSLMVEPVTVKDAEVIVWTADTHWGRDGLIRQIRYADHHCCDGVPPERECVVGRSDDLPTTLISHTNRIGKPQPCGPPSPPCETTPGVAVTEPSPTN